MFHLVLVLAMMSLITIKKRLPDSFVSLSEYCPQIKIEPRYSTVNNFTGKIVDGYLATDVFLSLVAAKALCSVEQQLNSQNLGLKVFDGYRPQKAVQFFKVWALSKEDNLELKEIYYPNLEKKNLFELGYISEKSSHSRGAALDLTLMELSTGNELDMGTVFDCFDEKSHTLSESISIIQKQNREILLNVMLKNGFKNYHKEWWHFSLINEPFPETYFDFDIH
jgi:D-alanyl-D-alanine dipeptidase